MNGRIMNPFDHLVFDPWYELKLGDTIKFSEKDDMQIYRTSTPKGYYIYSILVNKNNRTCPIPLNTFRHHPCEESVGGFMKTLEDMPSDYDRICKLAGKTFKVTNMFARDVPAFDSNGRRTGHTKTIHRPFIVEIPQHNLVSSSRFNILFEIDDKKKIITIIKGAVSNRTEFAFIYNEIMASKLAKQMKVGYRECVRLDIYNLYEALKSGDYDKIVTYQREIFERVYDYEIYMRVK